MLTVGALAVMSAIGVAAVAREGDGHGRHGGWHGEGRHHGHWGKHGGRHGKHGAHRLMKLKKLDADGNGEVTLEEFLKPREERFAKLDTDGKGSLGPQALVSREQAELDYRINRMLKRHDANGDGRITKDEFEKPARERFAKRDFNGDGKITDDELPPGKFGRGGRDDDDRDEARGDDDGPRDEARGEGRRFHRGFGRWWGRGDDARNLDDVLARVSRRFDRRDANKDGAIDKDEIAGRRAERITFEQRRRLHVLDANKDGSVSKDEFLARGQKRFSMLDLNGDGKIAADDLPPRAAHFWERKAEGKQDQ